MAAFDEKEYTQAFDWSIWKRLFPILGRFKRYFIGMIGTAAVSDLVDAALPLFQMYAIARFIEADTLDGLIPFAALYGAVILLQSVLVVVSTRYTMKIEIYLGRDLRKEMFEHLQILSLSFYNVTPVGYLLARVNNDTNRIGGNLAWNLLDLVDVVFYVTSTFAIMLMLNWRLALVVSSTGPGRCGKSIPKSPGRSTRALRGRKPPKPWSSRTRASRASRI